MTVVTMPDGQAVDFGNMPPDQIKALIQRKFPDVGKSAPAPSAPGGASPAAASPSASAPASPEYGSVFDPIMQGVTFGTFDELVGGIGGYGDMLAGFGIAQRLTCGLAVKHRIVDFCAENAFDQAEFLNRRAGPSDQLVPAGELVDHADDGR